jgi:hypothetical protein
MAEDRAVTSPRRAPGRGRIVVALLAVLAAGTLLAAAALGYAYLRPIASVPRPVVSIRSPGDGQQVTVGQPVAFSSFARSEDRIVRVELWADGQLQEVQTSSLPDGSSLLPLLANWQATTPGTHTLTARAFDSKGGRVHASVSLQAIQPPDRDGDGVLDANDACPDQPGWALTQGCPDRDGDGVVDAQDACPDEAGSAASDGCPQPAEGDRDGDGVADDADASPDEAGSAALEGRPLAAEPEPSPAEPPAPPPDADGDGVSDDRDLCPDAPGPADAGGCPPSDAGDRDGDGLADDADLAPEEPGLPEHGGCPPPDADADADGVADEEEAPEITPGLFRLLMPLQSIFVPVPKAMVAVEFEATGFLLGQDYDEVVCYACLGDGAAERIGPFRRLEGNSWDVAEYLGADAHRRLMLPEGEPLRLRMQCTAHGTYTTDQPESTPEGVWGDAGGEQVSYDLGTLEVSHSSEEWDGRELQRRSERDTPPAGQTFILGYRICSGTCEESPLPAPSLGLYDRGGDHALGWTWDGDPEAIDGFLVRCDCDRTGFFTRWAPKDWRILPVSDLEPDCGDTCSFTVAAHRNSDGVESPASNVAVWEGDPCPGYLYVNFTGVGSNSHCESGPIYGELWANEEVLWFDAADRFWGMEAFSAGLGFPHRDMFGGCSLDFQAFFDEIRGLDPGWDASYTAPASSRVCLLMRPYTDLNVGVRIYEDNPEGSDPVLAEGSGTIPASHLLSEDLNRSYGPDPFERFYRDDDIYFIGVSSDGTPFYQLVHSDGLLSFELEWNRRPDAP